MLLNSDELPEPNDMIGRCFMEHPHVLAGGAWLADAERLQSYFYGGPRLDVLTLPTEQQRSDRLLNASVQLRRLTWDPSPHVPVQCDLYVRAEQAPNPDSRVLLGERTDRFRRPQPSLQWEMLPQDWESVVHTAELVAAELRRSLDARVGVGVSTAAPWPGIQGGPQDSHNGTWGYHMMGTTRMADDPEQGVVDRDCLLHGTSNLYVAGSSVFPTGGCANPTFMIVALAHRLADHLCSRG
jgi:choline dehydrogenase-like flavoprotein